jgi:pyruvate,orthophosphate dikinase
MSAKKASTQHVYFFGGGKADGNESMKNLLGGKGANLAEMAGHPSLRNCRFLPVLQSPQKFVPIITRTVRNILSTLDAQLNDAMRRIEKLTGKIFGDKDNPLLGFRSVRSAALYARHDGNGFGYRAQ